LERAFSRAQRAVAESDPAGPDLLREAAERLARQRLDLAS